MYSMRHYGARFMLGEKVERIETFPDRAVVHLESGACCVSSPSRFNTISIKQSSLWSLAYSLNPPPTHDRLAHAPTKPGKRIAAEGVLHAMGRQGNTDTLHLEAVGLQADKRGLLDVNSFYQVRRLEFD